MPIKEPGPEGIEGGDSFERQFANVEEYKVAGGTAEVVDITLGESKSEVPVLFAPAWGCTTEVYKPALETLAKEERRVISLNHPRVGGDMSAAEERAPEGTPREQLRKAYNILGVLEQKGVEKTDVIAHSEAAINVAIAATLHPERFRNIVLFAPAGLIGEDTFSRLFKGFLGQSKRPESIADIPVSDVEKKVGAAAAREALKYLAKNPVRAFKESREMARSQIHDMLRYLHGKGIGIVVMAAADDPVFPMERMQQVVKSDMFDGFLSVRGKHGMIGDHPELYMTAAEKMLTAVEEKRKK